MPEVLTQKLNAYARLMRLDREWRTCDPQVHSAIARLRERLELRVTR